MRKRNALFIAICLILAILILNAPDINYNRGPDDTHLPDLHGAASNAYGDAPEDNHQLNRTS